MLHLTLQNFNPRDLLQNIFCPLVGAVSSPGADDICQKNNLTFVELLQPFSKITNDPVFRDHQGSSVSLKGIRLNISDIEWRLPQTVLARKMLNDAVSTINCENTKTVHLEGGKYSLEIPLAEPWYEQWRETFLAVQFPADHEFTRHLLACLVVVSSSEATPIESAQQLTNKVHMMQNVTPPKLPKWFSPDPLNCYVMLHDSCTGDVSKAQQSFEQLKALYGEDRCFLLQINSHQGAPGECPDPWLRFLKKQLKHEQPMEEYSISSPRTPQDITVTGLPLTMQLSALESNNGSSSCSTPPNMEIIIQHPLSPLQEQNSIVQMAQMATEEGLRDVQQPNAGPTINPNVWASAEASNLPEIVPHGMMLTPNDLENLKHFIQDFTIRALLPYIERLAFQLNDSIANKKGVSRSLLTATKRWFGTNKPGVAPATQNAVVYTNESTELQTRKLGDLYFMFGHYNAAFQSYHQAKRDFNADSAWQYYAGALEMAALSAFMQGTASRKTFDYMEEAILTYLNSCKMPQFATRATLLSAECLKASRLFGEAAKQFIRMTSEDSDLRSALFLEQASYSFLNSTPPLYRKYAFHSVLAGHRFSKAGQRKHAFRCYKQAYQVFKERGWSLAEDHIQYTIGKQALSLKRLTEASGALSHLLRPSSLQTPSQQGAFLREYIATHKSMQTQSDTQEPPQHLLQISLPRIVSNQTKVLVTSQPPVGKLQMVPATNLTLDSSQHDEWIWHKMEEMCLQSASKRPVMIFKPIKNLFTNHSVHPEGPLAIHGEPIEISVTLENTIKIPITFSDISLLWSFQGVDSNNQAYIVSNEEVLFSQCGDQQQQNPALRTTIDEIAYATRVAQVTITEHEFRTVKFKLTPKRVGTITVTGLVGQLAAQNEQESLWGKLEFEPLAIKPSGPQQGEKPKTYDKRLEIQVFDAAPALAISFSEIPSEVLAGELIPITMQFTNCGVSDISDLYMAFEHPRNFLVESSHNAELPLSLLRDFKDLTNVNLSRDKETRKQYVSRIFDTAAEEMKSPLAPNETRTARLWLQVPFKKGAIEMRTLAYYSLPGQYSPKMKYRLIRHSWNLMVIESVAIEANCNLTNAATEEIGVDVAVRNLNQVHHPVSTEVAVDELVLFCPKYRLRSGDQATVKFTSPGSERVFKQQMLSATELLNIRCAVEVRDDDDEVTKAAEEVQFIARQLSKLGIQVQRNRTAAGEQQQESAAPVHLERTTNTFLMKEETKYLRVFGQTSNNEEFNQIVSLADPHMTLVLNWSAAVKDNNATAVQRTAHGQHFVQMRHLYESSFCPRGSEHSSSKSFTPDENTFSIYDFGQLSQQQWAATTQDSTEWAVQNIVVSQRCFIEAGSASETTVPVH